MIRRPPRSTQSRSSAASDVYKRQQPVLELVLLAPDLLHLRGRISFDHMHHPSLMPSSSLTPVSYTHLRAHETRHDLVCRLLLEKKKKKKNIEIITTINRNTKKKRTNNINKE